MIGEQTPEPKLVVLSDTESTEGPIEPLRNANAPALEAPHLDANHTLAGSRGHITVGDAACLATAAGIHALYLNHSSRRYDETDILIETRTAFPGAEIAHDLDRVNVIHKRPDDRSNFS